jgi:hypothetical protein
MRLSDRFVSFLEALAELLGSAAYNRIQLSRAALPKWREYADSKKDMAKPSVVIRVLQSLQIGPNEGYLEHWFEPEDVPVLRMKVGGHPVSREKWWDEFRSDPTVKPHLPQTPTEPEVTQHSYESLEKAGLRNAFRIPQEDSDRLARVTELVRTELTHGSPRFRLLASSGYSYLHPAGPVWASAGLGDAVSRGAELDVVLESPFSVFAITRALVNRVTHNQWDDRGMVPHLRELLELGTVSLRVTGHPVNCSLFFTGESVFYDPYLWAMPGPKKRSENNFWVFDFGSGSEEQFGCYRLLETHYDFLRGHSTPLKEVLDHYDEHNQRFRHLLEACLADRNAAGQIDEMLALSCSTRLFGDFPGDETRCT